MKQFEFWHDHAGVSVPNLVNGNLRFEIFEPTGGKAPAEVRSVPDEDVRTWGNKHVCFGVDDVAAVGEELKRREADIVWIKQFPNGGANIFLRDNAGNLIEFVQRARPLAQPASL
jgi:methylmalonyl-CoA/ethylmalonyl-CoA epimerase